MMRRVSILLVLVGLSTVQVGMAQGGMVPPDYGSSRGNDALSLPILRFTW